MFDERVVRQGPWSLSKAGVLQNCSQQFDFKYVKKIKETTKSSSAQVGIAGHKIIELLSEPPKGDGDKTPTLSWDVAEKVIQDYKLPVAEAQTVRAQLPWIRDYLVRVAQFREAWKVQTEYSELKLGMTSSFEIAAFDRDPELFFRGVIDYAMRTEDGYLIIWDHKSGRRKPIQEHHAQLYSYMLLAMVNWPDLRGFQCGINYFGRDEIDWFPRHDGSSGVWTPQEVVQYVVPWFVRYLNTLTKRLAVIQQTQAGTPEPGWVCEYCGYVDRCPPGQAKVAERQAKRAGSKNV